MKLHHDLMDIAAGVTANSTDSSVPITVLDGDKMQQNLDEFVAAHPDVQPLVDVSICGSSQLIQFSYGLGIGHFSVHNKAELELALEAGVEPERLALVTPIKPSSQIRFAMSKGVHTIGCGSANEVAKAIRVSKQLGLEEQLRIVIVVDSSSGIPQSFESLLETIRSAQDHNVVALSLFGAPKDNNVAFAKAVASARLLFEMDGVKITALDLGEVTDDGWEVFSSQFKDFEVKLQVMAHVSNRIIKEAVALATRVEAVREDSDVAYIIINESIYGAFSGSLLLGQELEWPLLVSASASAGKYQGQVAYDILGCTGDDSDIIASKVSISGGRVRVGDWLLFPNICCSGSPLHLMSAGTATAKQLKDNDISELETLYELPDLSEESLECMFNI